MSAGLARAAVEGAGAGDAGFVVGRHSAPRVASGSGNTLQPVSGRSACHATQTLMGFGLVYRAELCMHHAC